MADPLQFAGSRATPASALELVGRSAAVTRVQELIRHAATLESGILLVAERGIHAPPVARELHRHSRRANAAFVHLDCAAANTSDELFGVVHGAAPSDLETISPGSRVAAARGGTLFLEDITELPSTAQARLGRILRDREVRVGSEPVSTELRVIATALPGIDEDLYAHRFRPDLYRRLAATRIDLPALRDRPSDVPALAARLVEDVCASLECEPRTLSQPALALLGALSWPGNLDELHETISRIVQDTGVQLLEIEHVLPALRLDRALVPFVPTGNLREARARFERDYISAVLQHHGWRIGDAAPDAGNPTA